MTFAAPVWLLLGVLAAPVLVWLHRRRPRSVEIVVPTLDPWRVLAATTPAPPPRAAASSLDRLRLATALLALAALTLGAAGPTCARDAAPPLAVRVLVDRTFATTLPAAEAPDRTILSISISRVLDVLASLPREARVDLRAYPPLERARERSSGRAPAALAADLRDRPISPTDVAGAGWAAALAASAAWAAASTPDAPRLLVVVTPRPGAAPGSGTAGLPPSPTRRTLVDLVHGAPAIVFTRAEPGVDGVLVTLALVGDPGPSGLSSGEIEIAPILWQDEGGLRSARALARHPGVTLTAARPSRAVLLRPAADDAAQTSWANWVSGALHAVAGNDRGAATIAGVVLRVPGAWPAERSLAIDPLRVVFDLGPAPRAEAAHADWTGWLRAMLPSVRVERWGDAAQRQGAPDVLIVAGDALPDGQRAGAPAAWATVPRLWVGGVDLARSQVFTPGAEERPRTNGEGEGGDDVEVLAPRNALLEGVDPRAIAWDPTRAVGVAPGVDAATPVVVVAAGDGQQRMVVLGAAARGGNVEVVIGAAGWRRWPREGGFGEALLVANALRLLVDDRRWVAPNGEGEWRWVEAGSPQTRIEDGRKWTRVLIDGSDRGGGERSGRPGDGGFMLTAGWYRELGGSGSRAVQPPTVVPRLVATPTEGTASGEASGQPLLTSRVGEVVGRGTGVEVTGPAREGWWIAAIVMLAIYLSLAPLPGRTGSRPVGRPKVEVERG